MRIVINAPDGFDVGNAAEYVRVVADEIEEGFTSGHVDSDTHWDSEKGTR